MACDALRWKLCSTLMSFWSCSSHLNSPPCNDWSALTRAQAPADFWLWLPGRSWTLISQKWQNTKPPKSIPCSHSSLCLTSMGQARSQNAICGRLLGRMLTLSTCILIIIIIICVQDRPIRVWVTAVALSAAFTLRRSSSIRSLLHQLRQCLIWSLPFLVFFGSQAVYSWADRVTH